MRLTDEQIQQLEDKDWNVKPSGCWIELYREDYSQYGWEEICKIIGNSAEANSVKVLIFGYAE